MRARFLSLSLLVLAAAPPSLAEQAPEAKPEVTPETARFQVIVHPSNPAQSVTRRELSDMFLKKVTRWAAGTTVEPVEPPEGSMTRAYFLSDVMNGRSALAIKAFWQKRVFSGRDTPPVEKGSDDEVVAFVKATPGAIGYVAPGTGLTGVKVLDLKD